MIEPDARTPTFGGLWSEAEAAKLLRCSPRLLWWMRVAGKLQPGFHYHRCAAGIHYTDVQLGRILLGITSALVAERARTGT